MTRKVLATLVVVGLAATVGGYGTFAAFSATTTSASNGFAAGTVTIGDNSAGASLYSVTGAKPGQVAQACIKVTYTGSLAATVSLYASATSGSLGAYLNLTIEKIVWSVQPSAYPKCDGTVQSATQVYPSSGTATLSSFTTSDTSFSTGVQTFPGSQTQWNQNDSLTYRLTLTLQSNNAAQGLSSTTSFTWEAQNQ